MPAFSAAAELRSVGAAFGFLSRLPLGAGRPGRDDVSRAAWAFPLAGAVLAALSAGVALAGAALVTPALGAALGVAAAVLLTGALHLDGLADTADALGGATPEAALRAMRDHAVGAYGATAIALDLGLRATLLAALLESGAAALLPAAVAAGAISRAAAAVLAVALPYAQPTAGIGAVLSRSGGAGRAGIALAIAAGVSLAALGPAAVPCLLAAAVAAVLTGAWCRRRFGGVSGDSLGAAVELVELASLATAAAIL